MAKVIDAILTLKDNFSATMDKATKSIENMSKQLKRTGRDVERIGDRISKVGDKLTSYATLPIIGVGAAATKMAMDAVESESLFEVSMGSMAKAARQWSEQVSKSLGLNAYEVRKNVGTFNVMLTSMGQTKEQALKMSENLTKLAYDMASFYNLSPEVAFEKLRSGISGEVEPLKQLGIIVNDTQVKTYALAHGIIKQGQEMTEAQKIQARYALIMQATSKAQGDLARTMNSPTNQIRILKEQATQLGIQFGQLLIPFLQMAIKPLKQLADTISKLTAQQKEMVLKIAVMVAAIGPLTKAFGLLVHGVGGAIRAFGNFGKGVKLAGGLMKFILSPANLVVLAIVAIAVAAFLIIKYWQPISAFFKRLWSGIVQTLGLSSNTIKTFVAIFKTVGSIVKFQISIVIAIIKLLYPIFATIFALIIGVVSQGVQLIIRLIGVFINAWASVAGFLSPIFKGIWSMVRWLVNGIIDFINILIRALNKLHWKIPSWVPGLGGKEFGFSIPQIPKLAKGTNYFAGGTALVGEEGPELVELPRGSKVIPTKKTEQIINQGNNKTQNVTINVQKFAEQIIVREEADIDKIAKAIVYNLQKTSLNYGGAS